MPVDFGLGLVAFALPSGDFVLELFAVAVAAVEALAAEDAEFDLGPAFNQQPRANCRVWA